MGQSAGEQGGECLPVLSAREDRAQGRAAWRKYMGWPYLQASLRASSQAGATGKGRTLKARNHWTRNQTRPPWGEILLRRSLYALLRTDAELFKVMKSTPYDASSLLIRPIQPMKKKPDFKIQNITHSSTPLANYITGLSAEIGHSAGRCVCHGSTWTDPRRVGTALDVEEGLAHLDSRTKRHAVDGN